MDAAALRDAVETAKQSELDRLGSSKYLIALTGADLGEDAVLAAVAESEYLARETFAGWRDDATDDDVREAFSAVADQEAEHYDRVCDRLGARPEPDHAGAVHGYLREREDAVARIAGGLVGRPLVSLRAHTQVVGFYVNEADRAGADLFRDLKAETAEELDTGLELLDAHCETDEDRERAQATAEYVVQLAYDEYADSLTELGVNPKSTC
ncbi:rubrerythrin family protein [Halorubellus sp. JP-L1]|uniref:rubrerythrin family protein n=1 Tax=Halorubellus sp. JP-L1 TaxID=2715753 RepID=UPI0014086852|nr:rubrerythrin family protein [Halorubellus sp. JP-L1]NHN42462.1 rubrerythrin family protein [Halorubellus sp. JP-L1]